METDGNIVNQKSEKKAESDKPMFFALDNETPDTFVDKQKIKEKELGYFSLVGREKI